MTKDQCIDQLSTLFLTDPVTGADMVFCSDIQTRPGGFNSFELMNVETGEKQKVTFKIEEI